MKRVAIPGLEITQELGNCFGELPWLRETHFLFFVGHWRCWGSTGNDESSSKSSTTRLTDQTNYIPLQILQELIHPRWHQSLLPLVIEWQISITMNSEKKCEWQVWSKTICSVNTENIPMTSFCCFNSFIKFREFPSYWIQFLNDMSCRHISTGSRNERLSLDIRIFSNSSRI